MNPIIALISLLLSLYTWAVLIYVVMQLLAQFKILNSDQIFVIKLNRFLAGIIEPALSKIRKYIKSYNGMDFSPLVLLIILWFIQYCLQYYFRPY